MAAGAGDFLVRFLRLPHQPARHPDAERLQARVLERPYPPIISGLHNDQGLARSAALGIGGVNQGHAFREPFDRLDFGRNPGALEDAAEKTVVHTSVLGPPANVHALKRDVIGILGKARCISFCIAARPRIALFRQSLKRPEFIRLSRCHGKRN